MKTAIFQFAALLLGLIALSTAAGADLGVTTTGLNLRACPGTEAPCDVILTLPAETELEILEHQGAWLKVVEKASGETGWVHGDFVRQFQPAELPPSNSDEAVAVSLQTEPPTETEDHSLLFFLTPFLTVLGALLIATGIVAGVLAWRKDRPLPEMDLLSKLTRPTSYLGPVKKEGKGNGFADVVMKGGITSGIVYPLALCELAREYRLRNIGGTSAGAIAASLAAAAEYGRRAGHTEGYAQLAKLPAWLGGQAEGRRRGNMLGLFQPVPAARGLFELLLLALAPAKPLLMAIRGFRAALFGLGIWPWLGLSAGLLLALFLTFTDLPASAVGLAVAAILWLLTALLWLALLSLPVADAARKKTLLAVGGPASIALIILGPLAVGRLVAPSLAIAGHTWAQEGALLLAALGMLAGCAVALTRKVLVDLPKSRFGICSGMPTSDGEGQPALVPWLHDQIQELAGLSESDPPLTFHDLEGPEPEDAKDPVNLRVMTTCLTFGRPYLLPFETKIFYFDEEEMAELFPKSVVDFMVGEADRWSESVAPKNAGKDLDPSAFPTLSDHLTNRYMYPKRPLPLSRLPVVVAVRMSLSFPMLLSAVPLWTIDWRNRDNQEAGRAWEKWARAKLNEDYWKQVRTTPGEPLKRELPKDMPDTEREKAKVPERMPKLERCWFSDGGICSNFPVHLFDQLLPRWPNFGINLKYSDAAKQRESRVELASNHVSGILPKWVRLAAEPGNEHGTLSKFLGTVFGAMQNWADNSMLRVPGYRDRIVHLHLDPKEGGFNLDMTPEQIGQLARWGREAGELLVQRFTNRQASGSELSWDNHRWTRLRSSLAFLQEDIEELVASYQDSATNGGPDKSRWRSYQELINRNKANPPTSYKWRWVGQVKMAEETFKRLADLVNLWHNNPDQPGFLDPDRPKPLPKLHIRPPLQK